MNEKLDTECIKIGYCRFNEPGSYIRKLFSIIKEKRYKKEKRTDNIIFKLHHP